MNEIIIYHNPRCSKSRQVLKLLNDQGIHPKIILYLEINLSSSDIKNILNKLGLQPREILRKSEKAYKDNDLKNLSLSDDEIIQLMVKFPKLIERPIVVKGNRAIIARPPERAFEIL